MAKSLLRVLAGERVEVPPVWLMRQAGRYLPEYREVRAKAGSFLDLCYQPELAAEVTLQPIRRFGFDAAILFSDILVIPDGLGQAVSFREGDGPRLDPIRTPAGLRQLDLARVSRHLGPVYEAVTRIRSLLPEDVALMGFAGAPNVAKHAPNRAVSNQPRTQLKRVNTTFGSRNCSGFSQDSHRPEEQKDFAISSD